MIGTPPVLLGWVHQMSAPVEYDRTEIEAGAAGVVPGVTVVPESKNPGKPVMPAFCAKVVEEVAEGVHAGQHA